MKLLVTELVESIEQSVVPKYNTNVQAVRVYLYKHNAPVGNFRVEIQNEAGKVITTSNEIQSTDITSADYFHGFVRFDIDAFLKKDQQYKIVLKAEGYTFDESAYLGWCNSFDLSSYDASYDVLNNVYSPLRLEIWHK